MATHQSLPTLEQLELADYKLDTFRSDLDSIASAVKRLSEGEITTLEEYREREARGDLPPAPELDRAHLARLIVFAAGVLEAVDVIREDAAEIQRHSLALFHEQTSPAELAAVRQRLTTWHAQQAREAV